MPALTDELPAEKRIEDFTIAFLTEITLGLLSLLGFLLIFLVKIIRTAVLLYREADRQQLALHSVHMSSHSNSYAMVRKHLQSLQDKHGQQDNDNRMPIEIEGLKSLMVNKLQSINAPKFDRLKESVLRRVTMDPKVSQKSNEV